MDALQERRYSVGQVTPSQVRAGSGQKVLSGLAAKFNHLSEDLGGFRERLAPGCFSASLASPRDIVMLADHDSAKVLGRRSNGTLRLREDANGLNFACDISPAVSHARDVYEMCKRGDLKECSFGFTCEDEKWADEEDSNNRSQRSRKIPVRTIHRASLIEVSAVTFPAYQGATNVSAGVLAGRSLFPAGMPMEMRSRIILGCFPGPSTETPAGRIAYTKALLQQIEEEGY
jgi:HK97 family phage prohead protease